METMTKQEFLKRATAKNIKQMRGHDDGEIVAILHRDFPNVYNQILEYLDNL